MGKPVQDRAMLLVKLIRMIMIIQMCFLAFGASLSPETAAPLAAFMFVIDVNRMGVIIHHWITGDITTNGPARPIQLSLVLSYIYFASQNLAANL